MEYGWQSEDNFNRLIFQSNSYNFVYFRVPKCASTSILMSLNLTPQENKVLNYNKSYFKFTLVRNPFNRIVSAYKHVIQKGALSRINDIPELYREMSFEDLITYISKQNLKNLDIHFRPQWTFIPEKPDFIGKVETINEDFNKLIDILKIKPRPELRWENKTDKIKYSDYYNKKTIKKVIEIYKKDFILLKYSMNL